MWNFKSLKNVKCEILEKPKMFDILPQTHLPGALVQN